MLKVIKRIIVYLVISILLFMAIMPLIWAVSTSFKPEKDYFVKPPVWVTSSPTLKHYRTSIYDRNLLHFLFNSIIVSVSATVLAIAIGTLAAYGFARMGYRKSLKENLSFFILSMRFAPPIAIAIPLYIMFSRMRMLDTLPVLIIVYTLINIPFTVWIMQGFLEGLPQELEEAAWIDGCSRFGALIRIVLPLASPGLAATAIFCLVTCWNEFLFALLFTSVKAATTPILIARFVTDRSLLWGQLSAVTVISIAPLMVWAFVLQKYIVRGLTLGAVKE